MGLRLDIEEDGKRRAVRFTQPELTIGRGPDNIVVINDPRSSRHHLKISRTPQGLLLEDLESRNGTLLNGSAVKKSFVKPGDEFRIGNTRFLLADESAALASTGAAPKDSAAEPSDGEDILEDGPSSQEEEVDPSGLASTVSMKLDRGSTVSRGASLPARSGGQGTAVRASTSRAASPAAEAYLEGLDGEHSGEKIPLRKLPFLLGRGSECDFTLRDKRASGRHARILRDESGYVLEDLGSRNGTTVNKKPVKRALLFPGAVVQIGNSSFRAQVPGGPEPPGAGSGVVGATLVAGGNLTGEDFVKFDVDKFLARDRTQHPLAVLAVVCILAILGYFTVDITLRSLEHQVADPAQETNRIAQNWSFEDVPARAPGAAPRSEVRVPGWRIAAGDQGRMEVTVDHAQLPGSRALRVVSSSDGGLCRAAYEGDILLGSERRFRLEGYVLNQGAYAAGLLVEWLRFSGGGLVEVGRTYSETARQDGEAIDVGLVAASPASASHAKVSCLVVGSGTATFDRISFSPDAASGEPRGGGKKEKEKRGGSDAAESEVAKDPGRGQSLERVFQAGADDDPVLVALEQDGVFSISRKRKQLVPALWAGLPLERDVHAFGPRLAGVRSGSGESNPLLLEGEVPDEKEKRWVAVETSAGTSGGDVVLHWRASTAAEGQPSASLCLYMELRQGLASAQSFGVKGEAAGEKEAATLPEVKEEQLKTQVETEDSAGTIREITLGEHDETVSLSFTEPVKLTSRRHPNDATKLLWIAEGAPASIEVRITHGSRQEARAAEAHALAAEKEFRAGRVGAAMEMLRKLPQRFPEQKGAIQRAQERIEAWRKEASEALSLLGGEMAELRRTPTPVIYEILLARAAELKDRFAGAAESAQAEKILEEARQLWEGLASKKKEEERKGIYEKAGEYFKKNQLSLAELYFRWARDADPQGEMGRDAAHKLKLIEGRKKGALDVLLQQAGRP